jgi:hypothetical protein
LTFDQSGTAVNRRLALSTKSSSAPVDWQVRSVPKRFGALLDCCAQNVQPGQGALAATIDMMAAALATGS